MQKGLRTRKKSKRMRRLMTVDEFIEHQLSRYIKIHKEHEKEINYIG